MDAVEGVIEKVDKLEDEGILDRPTARDLRYDLRRILKFAVRMEIHQKGYGGGEKTDEKVRKGKEWRKNRKDGK